MDLKSCSCRHIVTLPEAYLDGIPTGNAKGLWRLAKRGETSASKFRHGIDEMLSVGNTGLGSGASLSLDVRAAVGASVLGAGTNVSSAPVDTTTAPDAVTSSTSGQQVPAAPVYNAFEFIYRSDFGKIILREQNVETGQEVTQVPSEYHLQQYAATQRAQRVLQQARLLHPENGGTQPRSGAGTKTAGTTSGTAVATSTGQSVPSPAPAPAAQPAPQAAPVVAAAAAAPAAHVDIKV